MLGRFWDQGPLWVRIWLVHQQPRCTSTSSPTAAITTLQRRQTTFLEVSVAAMRRPGHPFLPVFLSLLPLQHKPPICSFSASPLLHFSVARKTPAGSVVIGGALKCKIHLGSSLDAKQRWVGAKKVSFWSNMCINIFLSALRKSVCNIFRSPHLVDSLSLFPVNYPQFVIFWWPSLPLLKGCKLGPMWKTFLWLFLSS